MVRWQRKAVYGKTDKTITKRMGQTMADKTITNRMGLMKITFALTISNCLISMFMLVMFVHCS